MDIDTNEQLIAFCQEALRIPSYSGQEQGVAELMKRKMEEYGFDEVIIDRFGSVLGTINGKRPGKTVLMDGHIDTVDVIDAPQWEHDPFGGEIADGKIYGRGASDMKGSDCAMITAAARFAEKTGRDFAGRVCVSCTVHEERFEGVSSREITRLAKPDLVIIGEATSTTIKRGQRGRAEVVVETEGVSCLLIVQFYLMIITQIGVCVQGKCLVRAVKRENPHLAVRQGEDWGAGFQGVTSDIS